MDVRFKSEAQDGFTVVAERAVAQLDHGSFVLKIGDDPVRVELFPMILKGRLEWDGRLVFDVHVGDAGLEIGAARADLGLLDLAVDGLTAQGSGRFQGLSNGRMAFSGRLEARADMTGTELALGELGATLADGSSGALHVTELVLDRGRIAGLNASADLTLALASGSIPLGPGSVVRFSQGAVGVAKFARVTLQPGATWPLVEGKVQIEAQSDPVALGDLLEIPRGRGALNTGLTLDPTGHLSLTDLEMNLSAE